MRCTRLTIGAVAALALVGCQSNPDRQTIAELRGVAPDLADVRVDDGLVKAMSGYRHFLEKTPAHAMAPEAMRRLADLQIEKEYGIIGDGEQAQPRVIELAAPEPALESVTPETLSSPILGAAKPTRARPGGETDAEFERRTTASADIADADSLADADLPEGMELTDRTGPTQAIETYQKILTEYPWYERNDQVLYQMARAYDELGQPDEAMRVVERLTAEYPDSGYLDEVLFRRGEYHFVRRQYLAAEEAYMAVVGIGEASAFYELALYKLGWSLYKQEFYEEALHRYIALLDYKLSTGYDFDAVASEDEEGEERRVADTFRVVSLSFSNLGGAEVLNEYFTANGTRSYEDRIYRNLAEFHLDKRRFNDAAEVYEAFVELNPLHKVSPRFSMRISEIYAEGDFPLLVVESKRDFATRYAIGAEYWQYFDIESMPDVHAYLKSNLIDLANHYHALYQHPELEDDRGTNYDEASHWYGEFLASFPKDERSPGINYQLADLLLENEDFTAAAREYERTAYDYEPHERAAEAGYAAIYAHREHLTRVAGSGAAESEENTAKLATVESSLRFAERFPEHDKAATVLGAATEDLYAMRDYARAITAGRWLIDVYPDADRALRRAAWMIVAHSSFEIGSYPDAEHGYARVLDLSSPEDTDRQKVTDNLAAAIYKQGEQARALEDHATAAAHFLRIKTAAPESGIRAAAEYDAAASLILLEDWPGAAVVLEDYRTAHPEHELYGEATRQLAVVYEKSGELARSASEYERVAADATEPEMRREAILVAGDLYDQAGQRADALRVYEQYVDEFPEPVELALEIRFKAAGMRKSSGDDDGYLTHLEAIVAVDRDAGASRTDRTRYLAANAALVLTEPLFERFDSLALTQPFERSLAEKRRLMDRALDAFESLVSYEVGEVTAAATFYMARIYGRFSDALVRSERPAGLSGADLEEYELAIEEEAYPFEERAIEVHQANLELIRAGVFNPWVQRSLDELAVLMPGRYAKHEISSGLVGTIDAYAYRAPAVPVEPAAEAAEVESVHEDAEPDLETLPPVASAEGARRADDDANAY